MYVYTITQQNGKQHEILLDDDSPAINMSICRQSAGYCFVHIKRKKVLLHRWLMGFTDPNILVDHVDRCKNNYQLENLRVSDKQRNGWNADKRKNNSTGCIGVVKTRNGKFRAQIASSWQKCVYIGTFDNIREAEIAYDMTCYNLRGDIAVLNNPDNVFKNAVAIM